MRFAYFRTFLLALSLHSARAQDWNAFCDKKNDQIYSVVVEKCETNSYQDTVSPLRQLVVSNLGQEFDDWALISHANLNLQKRLQIEVDAEKDFFRFLRGDQGYENQRSKYGALVSDFNKLKKIISEQRKNENCKSELCQHDRKILEELKFSLLSSNVYLADPEVEKCLISEIENKKQKSCRTKAFVSSAFNFINSRMDLKEELSRQILDENNALLNGDKSYKIHHLIYPFKGSESYYQAILPEIYRLAKNDPNRYRPTACRIVRKKDFRDRVYLASELTLEAGLCVAPFFFPPLGVARIGRMAYLAKYGLTSEKVVASGISVSTAAVLSSIDLKQEEQVCLSKQEVYRSQPSVENYKDYQECLASLSDQKMIMSAGIVLAVGVPLPFGQRIEKFAIKGVVALKKEADAVLSAIRPIENDAKRVADAYYEYVAEVYQKRLNLSDDEIKSFMKSSREMGDRTLLLVKTKLNPAQAPPQFKGGIGVVQSRSSEELLPLEKATGFKVPRVEGVKSIEIVRLVSTDEANPNLMKELLNEAMTVVASDPSIKKAYVYTSRIHERLYRKFNIPYKVINHPNQRDVIMEFEIPR